MFYMPRLFIYNVEAESKTEEVKLALREQFTIMMKRLWYGITWPSAILTLIFGPAVMFMGHWQNVLFQEQGRWLLLKLIFVVFLYLYFYTLHIIFKQQIKGIFRYNSQQLRVWNEVATIFLIAIIMLVVVKQAMSLVWGLMGLVCFIIVLMSAIKIYKAVRK